MWFNILRQVHGHPSVPNRPIPSQREYMTPSEWLHAHSVNWWVLLLFGMVVCCNLITISVASWLDNQNDNDLREFACRSYNNQVGLAGDGARVLIETAVNDRIARGEDPNSPEIVRIRDVLGPAFIKRAEDAARERLGELPPGCESIPQ